jgi:hypothetical protein
MASNKLSSVLVVAIIGVASFWYFSPYLSVHQMREAARSGDAATFNAHVDYPKLRENIKTQFSSMLGDRAAASTTNADGSKNTVAAIGTMLGVALADRMIDGMLRPEFVMKAMKNGKWGKLSTEKAGEQSENKEPNWTSERQGLNKFIVHLHGNDSVASSTKTAFVFERVGFAHWSLTEIDLPAVGTR